MIKDLIEDTRKWQREWDMYGKSIETKEPMSLDEFEKKLIKHLSSNSVNQQRELLKSFCKYIDLESKAHPEDIKIDIENHLKIFNKD